MNRLARPIGIRPTVLALAMLAALGPACAQTSEADGSIGVGFGLVSGNRADRALYDQYSGLRPGASVFGVLGGDYWRRDEAAGTSTQFQAVDLLNDNRELGFRWQKQGDWKFSADYRELVRRDPNVVNTGLLGAGTTTPTVAPLAGGPGSGSDSDLKTRRTGLGVAFQKILTPRLQFDVGLQSENRTGSRLFGIGMACPSAVAPGCRGTTGTEVGSAVLLLPEPIDSNHSQIDARLSYAGDQLRLSAGYYGSFYRNANGSLTANVPGSLYNPLGTVLPLAAGLQSILSQPIALPPDNQAHQIDLLGNYAFTRTTNLNFKLAYTQATQHQDFAAAGFTAGPAGVADLGGKVVTSLAQVGLTSRPWPKVSLLVNLRYEDRDDRTPIAPYNLEGASTYTNRRLPYTTALAKAQASYQFTSDYRGTLGAAFESIDRGVFTATSAVAGISALRQKTDETAFRAELRRRMSESFSGAISVESSRRDGSNWLKDNSGLGVTEVPDPNAPGTGFSTAIFMPTLADRKRDKVKLHADWQPLERLSLQLVAEDGRDRFSAPSVYGVRSAGMSQVSVDWDYAISDSWSVNGYIGHGEQELNQSRPGATFIAYDNTSTSVGVGFSGKPAARYEIGGGLAFIDDRSRYAQTLDPTAGAGDAVLLAATGGLPDIVFRQATLRLFGKFTPDKQSTFRIDLVHQHSNWNDWAWAYNGVPFVYSDGTTVRRQPVQKRDLHRLHVYPPVALMTGLGGRSLIRIKRCGTGSSIVPAGIGRTGADPSTMKNQP